MAGLFGSNYNPYFQGGYTPNYNGINYQNQGFNNAVSPNLNMPQTTLTYATEEEIRGMRLANNSQFVAFDREKPILYIKSTDNLGGSVTERFEYKKVEEKQPSISNDTKDYITKDDLKNLVTKEDMANYVSRDEIKSLMSTFGLNSLNTNTEIKEEG